MENLRKVIKFDQPKTTPDAAKTTDAPVAKEPSKQDQAAPPKPTVNLADKTTTTADAAREDLEQRRTILQNLKDFDFQIKKNAEDITNITEKVESLSKDLDDLVSLYEIVSEQMNPFVGLSKVTKKRLDALENITAEVESLKTKLSDMETSPLLQQPAPRPVETPKPPEPKPIVLTTSPSPTTVPAKTEPQGQPTQPIPPPTLTIPPITVTPTPQPTMTLPDMDLDIVLSKALESVLIDQQFDAIMNDFVLSLK